jgi:hypothetical protein
LKTHAKYQKYYFTVLIWILRLKCRCCGRTHAIIPSFSLPGTTIGSKDAEAFLLLKEQGQSTYKAGNVFTEKGMHGSYKYKAPTIFYKYFERAKAIFLDKGNNYFSGLKWIRSVIGDKANLITNFNHFCLSNKVNAVFCNRINILLYPGYNPGNEKSHKIPP